MSGSESHCFVSVRCDTIQNYYKVTTSISTCEIAYDIRIHLRPTQLRRKTRLRKTKKCTNEAICRVIPGKGEPS